MRQAALMPVPPDSTAALSMMPFNRIATRPIRTAAMEVMLQLTKAMVRNMDRLHSTSSTASWEVLHKRSHCVDSSSHTIRGFLKALRTVSTALRIGQL